jgi:serine/threonine protein kinase/tetratricopeptide (TPR) repeat protein
VANLSPQQSGANEPDTEVTHAAGPVEATVGTVIGPYHMVQLIGRGGMGEVWLAEQKEPVRRRVAVKLIKAGMDTREVVARFEAERQALALMDHPAIAKVFDGGSTPLGRPYFVMEYVTGIPITAYCDQHKLTTPQRLELFVRVCEGVQHAHQKAIIHRDLKPSNILVSEVDGKPLPRIIDFGVAKATSQRLTADTMFTRFGDIVGTPGYMSPEQADSSGDDIDTRSDVYSLGVVLYELLVGALPLDFRNVPFEQVLHRLREEDAPYPSTRLRTLGEQSSVTAQNRGTDPAKLARQLRGDVDLITLKALEKHRSRRYTSASDLAADIQRHLKDEPISARPKSASYQLQKFARRHKALVAGVAAVFAVLIAGIIVSTREATLARRAEQVATTERNRAVGEKQRADAESAAAKAVNDFLQNDLLAQASAATQSGPRAKPDPDLKVRTALDRAAARIAGKLDRQPEVEAAIRETIGQTYMDLGLYPEGRTQLERALELHRRVLGADNPKTLKTISRLGTTAFLQGKFPEAEALFGQTLNIQRRVLGPEHPDTLASMNSLANVYYSQGKYARAESLHSQTLEIERRVLGPEHPETLKSTNNLAIVYSLQGKYAQAEELFSQTLEIDRRVLGPEHPATLGAMHDLANVYQAQGKYAQAEALDSQALEIERRVLGPEHPGTLGAMNNLADD